jgi:hypothetical protein
MAELKQIAEIVKVFTDLGLCSFLTIYFVVRLHPLLNDIHKTLGALQEALREVRK